MNQKISGGLENRGQSYPIVAYWCSSEINRCEIVPHSFLTMREVALSRREPAWVSADNACVSMLLCLYDPENELGDDILMLTSIANLI